MRFRLLLAAAGAVLLAGPVQGQSKHFEIYAVAEPTGSYSEYQGYDLDLGLGGGVGWRFSPHWAIELRGLFHSADFADAAVYQLGLRYALGDDDARWRPFVVAGAHSQEIDLWRMVDCSGSSGMNCNGWEQTYRDTGLFAGGGVDWQFARMWALRLEGRIAVFEPEYEGQWADEGGTQDDIDLTIAVAFRF